jgi:hypothetical protein
VGARRLLGSLSSCPPEWAVAPSISEKTVRNHTSNIYRKLHIFDRTQAVIYAIREGVIDVKELEYRPPREP